MNSPDPVPTAPAAIPWYQSAVLQGILVAGATRLLAFLNTKWHFDLTAFGVSAQDLAGWILNIGTAAALAYAAHGRISKTLPQITATPSAAKAINAQSTSSPQSGFASVSILIALALVALATCTTLTGCAAVTAVEKSVGVTQPTTFSEKYASGVAACTAAITTTDTLFNAKKITASQAGNISEQVQVLKHALDIAQVLYATDKTSAGNQVDQALAGLTAITNMLAAQGGK